MQSEAGWSVADFQVYVLRSTTQSPLSLFKPFVNTSRRSRHRLREDPCRVFNQDRWYNGAMHAEFHSVDVYILSLFTNPRPRCDSLYCLPVKHDDSLSALRFPTVRYQHR